MRLDWHGLTAAKIHIKLGSSRTLSSGSSPHRTQFRAVPSYLTSVHRRPLVTQVLVPYHHRHFDRATHPLFTMLKSLLSTLLLLSALTVNALPAPAPQSSDTRLMAERGLHLIDLEDGTEPVWRTEEQVLDFIRAGTNFVRPLMMAATCIVRTLTMIVPSSLFDPL